MINVKYMQIEYRLSREEYEEACRVNARVKWRRYNWRQILGYATVSLGVLLLIVGGERSRLIATLTLIALGLWILIGPVWQGFSAVEKQWKEYESTSGFTIIEADENAVRIRATTWQSELRWQSFSHFVESSRLLMLYGRSDGGKPVIIIPKSAFDTPKELADFRALLEAQLKDSRSTGGFPVVSQERHTT